MDAGIALVALGAPPILGDRNLLDRRNWVMLE